MTDMTSISMTNNKPGVSSGDDFAFWERMHLIPFKISFVSREPKGPNERPAVKGLPDLLKKEAPGILAWLVRGCLDYQKNGLPLPQAVINATLEYREDEDNLGQFIEAYCTLDPNAKVQSSDIFAKFDIWFKKNISVKGISHKRFGQMMNKKFERKKITGVNHYVGVELDTFKAAELGED